MAVEVEVEVEVGPGKADGSVSFLLVWRVSMRLMAIGCCGWEGEERTVVARGWRGYKG